jgi:hypothetical protein
MAASWLLPTDNCLDKERINAVKRSAVSTGKLSALLHLHIRPIDPVVFREPSSLRTGDRNSSGAAYGCPRAGTRVVAGRTPPPSCRAALQAKPASPAPSPLAGSLGQVPLTRPVVPTYPE